MIYFRTVTKNGKRRLEFGFFMPFRDASQLVQWFAALDYLTSLV